MPFRAGVWIVEIMRDEGRRTSSCIRHERDRRSRGAAAMSCCAPGTEARGRRCHRAAVIRGTVARRARPLGDGLVSDWISASRQVHCGACITPIEGALSSLHGVERARVNLSTRASRSSAMEDRRTATDPARSCAGAVVDASGYDAHLFTRCGQTPATRCRNELIRAVGRRGFAAGQHHAASRSRSGRAPMRATRDLFHWISAMIAAPALIYGGRFFFQLGLECAQAWPHQHGRADLARRDARPTPCRSGRRSITANMPGSTRPCRCCSSC